VITDVEGVRVGHWTDHEARTGCTVVLLPDTAVASGEVRGGAPATREFALLDLHRTVGNVNAVVLSGGSAFGLASSDGVMRWLEERKVGFTTSAGVVPIVVGMSLFDLTVGDGSVRPGHDHGYAACEAAVGGPFEVGRVGAGTGGTVGKWRGAQHARPAGLGTSTVRVDGVTVAALMAVNATGDVDAGSSDDELDAFLREAVETPFGNTTIGVVATDARLDKAGCHLAAQGGHDGVARALFPPHSRMDGDAIVVAATGQVDAGLDVVRAMTVLAVERAIRAAATSGSPPPAR
jgi:L-aminopeptidase/D-esterase-like protein